MQVLEWVRAAIDSHLGRLLMSKTPSPHFERMQTALRVQVGACQQLLPLQGAADHIRCQAPLPAAHVAAATQYTVELLDLSIRSQ